MVKLQVFLCTGFIHHITQKYTKRIILIRENCFIGVCLPCPGEDSPHVLCLYQILHMNSLLLKNYMHLFVLKCADLK